MPGDGGRLGSFYPESTITSSAWGRGCWYVHVCMLFCVILDPILIFLSHFFIPGIRSVISLQTDKAVISPVEKSHNRSEIFWPGFRGNYQILPFNSAGSSLWSVEMRKYVAWTCFNWFLDDFHMNCEIVAINRKGSISMDFSQCHTPHSLKSQETVCLKNIWTCASISCAMQHRSSSN